MAVRADGAGDAGEGDAGDGTGESAASVAARAPVLGWVLAVFRIQSFVERIFAPLIGRGLRVEIRDLQDETTPPFIAGDASGAGTPPAWRYERDMPLAGRVWRFTFTPGPRFRAADPDWLRRAAEILQRTNETLERRVAERTAELAARGAALERANAELRAEAARREAAESALARADAQLSLLTEAETRQWALAGLVGRSARFGQMLREVRAVQGAARTTVLLTGESGTGKELTARAIHYGGAQATAPFVRVDCAALPADQAEALLFGQARGGGPGAVPERRGYCELAEGGTLFFDEIGDLPPGLQARLLRVLEDGAYLPLGAHAPRTMNARVIAATHANLPALITAGRFRQDLYYRLMHYHIAVPALRERLQDVPALAQHFVRMISAELKRAARKQAPKPYNGSSPTPIRATSANSKTPSNAPSFTRGATSSAPSTSCSPRAPGAARHRPWRSATMRPRPRIRPRAPAIWGASFSPTCRSISPRRRTFSSPAPSPSRRATCPARRVSWASTAPAFIAGRIAGPPRRHDAQAGLMLHQVDGRVRPPVINFGRDGRRDPLVHLLTPDPESDRIAARMAAYFTFPPNSLRIGPS